MKKLLFLSLIFVFVFMVGCLPTVATRYLLTLNVDPAIGGEISGGGRYSKGYTVTIVATPSTGWDFVDWRMDGTYVSDSTEYQYIMNNSNATITAHFAEETVEYALTVTASPATGGTASGSGAYPENATITLEASPATNWTFENWTKDGTVLGTDTSLFYTMPDATTTIVANFVQDAGTFNLSVAASPTTGGAVSGAGTYLEDATVTLTATPSTNWTFENWTNAGTVLSSDTTYIYTMPGTDATVVANFAAIPPVEYTLSTVASPTAGGSVSAGGDYEEGATITLCATPNNGWRFENWLNGTTVVGSDSTYLHTMADEAATLTALFEEIEQYLVNVRDLPEDTEYEFYDGTDLGYWQLYIFPELIEELPSTGVFTLRVFTEEFAFQQKNGDVYATIPVNLFGKVAIVNNGIIVAEATDMYAVTVVASPSEGGTANGAGYFAEGATVTLVATPTENWHFVNWMENTTVKSTAVEYQFVMGNESREFIANFEADEDVYNLSVGASPVEAGQVSGAGYYHEGATVTLLATPTENWDFDCWKSGVTELSTSNVYLHTMGAANATLTTWFTPKSTETVSVALNTLTEDTQYEFYDGTDIGYWQVYIFPALIGDLPSVGHYKLEIFDEEFVFEQKNGSVYATVPTSLFGRDAIRANGVIVWSPSDPASESLLKDLSGGMGVFTDDSNVYNIVDVLSEWKVYVHMPRLKAENSVFADMDTFIILLNAVEYSSEVISEDVISFSIPVQNYSEASYVEFLQNNALLK